MKLVQNKFETPPGQWNYTEPSTGVKFKTYAFDQLVDMVRKHKKGNNIEMPPDWVERMENLICEQNELLPCHDPEKTVNGCALSLTIIVRFLGTIWNFLQNGGTVVEQSEADRRADICFTCPYNVMVNGCCGCKSIRSKINDLKGDKVVRHEEGLLACGKCCCENRTSVWIPLEAIDYPDVEFPSWCWKRPDAQNKPLQDV